MTKILSVLTLVVLCSCSIKRYDEDPIAEKFRKHDEKMRKISYDLEHMSGK